MIADNGSEDGTSEIAEELAGKFDDVFSFSLSERGRGRALRKVWTQSSADILAYTDVDISTELEALEKLCRAIWEEGYDIAIGSRLMKDSRVTRGLKREFISRGYNLFLKSVLFTSFSDAQCGFKAVSALVARDLVPQVKDSAWFSTPSYWCLPRNWAIASRTCRSGGWMTNDSRVRIISAAWKDVRGVFA